MKNSPLIQIFDRLLADSPLIGKKSSIFGVIGTIALIALCLIIYIPTVLSYFRGYFYQSEMSISNYPLSGQLYADQDFKVAISFRNKITNVVYNHSKLSEYMNAYLYFTNVNNTYQQKFISCDPNYFMSNTINPIQLEDCIQIPAKILFDISYDIYNNMAPLEVIFKAHLDPIPFRKWYSNEPAYSKAQLATIDLFTNYYYEYYFTSKVLTNNGQTLLQVHKKYSTNYQIGNFYVTSAISINMDLSHYYIDDSIMPWKNNRTVQIFKWQGDYMYSLITSDNLAAQGLRNAYQSSYSRGQGKTVIGFRYYRKLDWLLGIIGGGMFLLHLFFWVCCSYINKTLLKMEQAEKLLLKNISSQYPTDQTHLQPIRISYTFFLTNLLPSFFKCTESDALIKQSERENDIVNLIKKIKVTTRNLNKKEKLSEFKQKALIIQAEEDLYTSDEDSNLNSRYSKQKIQNDEQQRESEQNQDIQNQDDRSLSVSQSSNSSRKSIKKEKVSKKIQKKGGKRSLPPINHHHHHVDQSNIIMPHDEIQQNIPRQTSNLPNVPVKKNQNNPQGKLSQEKNKVTETDSKFNLTSQNLEFLKQNQRLNQIYENNLTVMIYKEQTQKIKYLFDLQKNDQNQGHFIHRKRHCCRFIFDGFTKIIRKMDMFGAKVNFETEPEGGSFLGIFLTLLIVSLSVLTFALMIRNMNSIQFFIDQNYVATDLISYSRNTDKKFNAVVCFSNITQIQSGSLKTTNFNYFLVNDGVKTYLNPVQTNSATDGTILNFDKANLGVNLNYCYKLPSGVTINMAGTSSYFGFQMTPFCSGSTSFCSLATNTTNSNFVNSINNLQIKLYLPSSRYNPPTNTLVSDTMPVELLISKTTISYYSGLEQTLLVDHVNLIDDSQIRFFGSPPPVSDHNIRSDRNSLGGMPQGFNNTTPFYRLIIKPSNTQTNYIIKSYNLDLLFGVIGGVFVFWYALIHCFGKAYNYFRVRAKLAKTIYDETGFDDCLLNQICALSSCPTCLVPSFYDMKMDVFRMKQTDIQIKGMLNYLSIIKLTDNCFRLSSAFLNNMQSKNLSLIYFKQKIDESANVKNHIEIPAAQVTKLKQDIDDNDFIEFLDDFQQNENSNKINNIDNSKQQPNLNKSMQNTINPMQDEQDKPFDQCQGQNYIQQPPSSKLLQFFDIYSEKPTLSLHGQRKISSCFGGLLSIITIGLIIIVAWYQVAVYLNKGKATVSYQTIMDDLEQSNSLTLIAGQNFKLGLNFISNTVFKAVNVSSLIGQLGIALLEYQFVRIDNVLMTQITQTNLISCRPNYFSQWSNPSINVSYFKNANLGYCLPDGHVLKLSGQPNDKIQKKFKISIFSNNSFPNATSTITNLLNKTHIQYLFSSPKKNSISHTIQYQMESYVMKRPSNTKFMPAESNISLSKVNITYDDKPFSFDPPMQQSTYIFDPVDTNRMQNLYTVDPTKVANVWYNISFSYSGAVRLYTVSTPKFSQVFGVIGGVIAFFVFIMSCCGHSFNKYRMKYLIGKELYQFSRVKFKSTKIRGQMKLRRSKQQKQKSKQINNLSQWNIFIGWTLSPLGWLLNNYNINNNLRRLTLIQQKIQCDLSLNEYFKKLHQSIDKINQLLRFQNSIKVTNIYPKHIYVPDKVPYTYANLLNYAKKHNLNSYEQMIVYLAGEAKVNIRQVFDNKFLLDTFNVLQENSNLNLGNLRDTDGTLGSNSIGSFSEGGEVEV